MKKSYLSLSTGGQRLKKRESIQRPLMKRQDSELKRSMKTIMKMGRERKTKIRAQHD